jgi:hypothetical protein
MHNARRSRTNLQGLDEDVFIERHLHIQVDDINLTLSGYGELDGHFENEVRLAVVPPIPGRHRLRHIGLVAFGRARVDPRDDGVDLRLTQACVVAKAAMLWISAPGRHLARDHFRLDRLRPGAHVLIGQQRHRPDFPGAMTVRAFAVEDRRDVLGECQRRACDR